jgi:hypothetical protein
MIKMIFMKKNHINHTNHSLDKRKKPDAGAKTA